MLQPTFSTILTGAALMAVLLGLDWFVWGLTYQPDFRRKPAVAAKPKPQELSFDKWPDGNEDDDLRKRRGLRRRGRMLALAIAAQRDYHESLYAAVLIPTQSVSDAVSAIPDHSTGEWRNERTSVSRGWG